MLEETLEQARAELERQGFSAAAVRCDVSKPEDCEALVAKALESFGRLDVLVNNAGLSIISPFEQCTPETCRKVMEVNLLGSINASLAALPELKRQKGHLLFISSVSGIRAIPDGAIYSASKAGMRSLAESLRVELAPAGVHVGVVSPGFTTSEGSKTVLQGDGAPRPVNRPPHDTPEGVARQVAALIERRDRERVLTPLGQLTSILQRLSPPLLDRVLERRKLQS